MMYFSNDDARVLFVDKRCEVHEIVRLDPARKNRVIHIEPDILSDFTCLPFENDSFYHVVFDPPHAFITGQKGFYKKEYGTLAGVDWRSMISKGFSECFRVLRPNGTLIFKWSEISIPLKEILSLTPHKPLYGHRSGRQAQTHWCAFIKE